MYTDGRTTNAIVHIMLEKPACRMCAGILPNGSNSGRILKISPTTEVRHVDHDGPRTSRLALRVRRDTAFSRIEIGKCMPRTCTTGTGQGIGRWGGVGPMFGQDNNSERSPVEKISTDRALYE